MSYSCHLKSKDNMVVLFSELRGITDIYDIQLKNVVLKQRIIWQFYVVKYEELQIFMIYIQLRNVKCYNSLPENFN